MMFVPHRKRIARSPRPVTGISVLMSVIIALEAVLHVLFDKKKRL
jgi:hypothetical protein